MYVSTVKYNVGRISTSTVNGMLLSVCTYQYIQLKYRIREKFLPISPVHAVGEIFLHSENFDTFA